jgi:hypothetical protein
LFGRVRCWPPVTVVLVVFLLPAAVAWMAWQLVSDPDARRDPDLAVVPPDDTAGLAYAASAVFWVSVVVGLGWVL